MQVSAYKYLIVVLFVLAVFFASFPPLYVSLYAGLLVFFDAYNFNTYLTISTAVHYCIVAAGLLLIVGLLTVGSRGERVEELVAVNCSLQGFAIQALFSIGLHGRPLRYIHGAAWVILDMTILFILAATAALFATAWALSTHRGWAKRAGQWICGLALVGYMLTALWSPGIGWSVGFTLSLIFAVTNAASIYYLRKPVSPPE